MITIINNLDINNIATYAKKFLTQHPNAIVAEKQANTKQFTIWQKKSMSLRFFGNVVAATGSYNVFELNDECKKIEQNTDSSLFIYRLQKQDKPHNVQQIVITKPDENNITHILYYRLVNDKRVWCRNGYSNHQDALSFAIEYAQELRIALETSHASRLANSESELETIIQLNQNARTRAENWFMHRRLLSQIEEQRPAEKFTCKPLSTQEASQALPQRHVYLNLGY